MSDYTVVTFKLPHGVEIKEIYATMMDLWDAWSIEGQDHETVTLTIHELDLEESSRILDTLKTKHGLKFKVIT